MIGEQQKFEIYFVTKVTLRRVPVFKLSPRYAQIVIDNFKFYRQKYHIKIYGYVIMPDHYHLIIDTSGRVSIAKFKEDMNKYIARCIIQDMKSHHPEILNRLTVNVKPRKGHKPHQFGLFQKGKYDFEIVTPEKLLEKLQYMHENPLRKSLVNRMEDYPFSSAKNYILDDHSLIKLDPLPV